MGELTGRPGGAEALFRRRRPGWLLLVSLAATAAVLTAAVALAATGDLTQLPGNGGCVSDNGGDLCADGHALMGAWGAAVSPDGENVYAVSYESNAVDRFKRNTTSGAIFQPGTTAGCVSEDGVGGCDSGRGLAVAIGVTVSPDGRNVYVASSAGDAVATFNRNPTTGAISQPDGNAGCISETGAGPCADGHALGDLGGIAVSPDGKSIYVTSFTSKAVTRLNRNPTTGVLTEPPGTAACVSETGAGPCVDGHGLRVPYSLGVSPDGTSVYATSQGASNAIIRLNRDTTTGGITEPNGIAGCISDTGAGACADGHALQGPTEVAVSPDRKSVYVASYFGDAVVRLNRSISTGAIAQPPGPAGCVSDTGAGGCVDGNALDGPAGVAVSPDGKNVYAAAFDGSAVDRFHRNQSSGAITQPPGAAGCVSETGASPCADGHGINRPKGIVVSPSGDSVYVASFTSQSVARLDRAP